MKKLILALAFVFTTFSAYNAHAGFYVTPKISYGFQLAEGAFFEDEKNYWVGSEFNFNASVFNGTIAAGYDFGKGRVEGEFGYFTDAKVSEVEFMGITAEAGNSIKTLFLNAYYDFDLGAPVSPYAGAGLGVAMHTQYAEAAGERVEDDTINSFAANIGIGVNYQVNSLITLDLGYRLAYLGMPSVAGGFGVTGAYLMNQVLAGVRFTF